MFLLPFETRHLHAPAGLHLTWQDLLVATDFEKTFSSDGLEPVMYISEVGTQHVWRGFESLRALRLVRLGGEAWHASTYTWIFILHTTSML